MIDNLTGKLEKAAEYIIQTSANETLSGNYYFYPEDMPKEILPPRQFAQYKSSIMDIMREYEAVAEVELGDHGCIDVLMYLDYCPNYERDKEEEANGEYPPDRIILDPLNTRQHPIREENRDDKGKPTLMERLAENKTKAASQGQPQAHKPKDREV